MIGFFLTPPATTELYTLSLHDALPIWASTSTVPPRSRPTASRPSPSLCGVRPSATSSRSEEHTSELQSHVNLVCRLLLEKKNTPECLRIVTFNAPVRRRVPVAIEYKIT